MQNYQEIVCQIFGVETYREIPYTLQGRLDRINDMIIGGELVSRQVVAVIVEQWERDYDITEE